MKGTTMTDLPTITRDDLKLSYGYIHTSTLCPACDYNDAGNDLRLFALQVDGRRICDECTEKLTSERLGRLLEKLHDLEVQLNLLEDDGPDDVEYGRALVVTGFRATITAFDVRFGTRDTLGGDTV